MPRRVAVKHNCGFDCDGNNNPGNKECKGCEARGEQKYVFSVIKHSTSTHYYQMYSSLSVSCWSKSHVCAKCIEKTGDDLTSFSFNFASVERARIERKKRANVSSLLVSRESPNSGKQQKRMTFRFKRKPNPSTYLLRKQLFLLCQ